MNIDKIRVVDRHRLDLGDLSDLAASISVHGLMHPIVVTSDLRLIAGQRRLEACKSLGWTEVPVTFVTDVAEASDLLEMERDENTCRKDMTPSECVALGRALEALEKPAAEKRKATTQLAGRRPGGEPIGPVPANGTEPRYDTREVVAPAVGMSTATYSRAKQIVTAAESGDIDAAVAVVQMDRTGKVTPAYEAWKGEPVNRGAAATTNRDTFGTAKDAPKPKSPVKNYRGRKPVAAMEGAVATLSGLTMPMKTLTAEDFADLPDEVRTRWTNELTQALSTLRRVRDLIKENS